MPTSQTSHVLQHLRRAVLLRDHAGRTDGQLLGCFLEQRDEAAFAALVRRHGPMVWDVCRRVLSNDQDAEDAFQATFLVLARKAASVVPREMVGNWLYGVAHHTALKARRAVFRRRAWEKQVEAVPDRAGTAPDSWDDLRPLLDQELSRLPDNYRVAIVLCDLEGKTRKEAARQLGWPEGTVAGRLVRAREMLAKRLARRGVALSGGAVAGLASANAASACVRASVVSSTIRAATLHAAGQATGAISAQVAVLTQGVLNAMFMTKLKGVITVALLLPMAFCGVGVVMRTASAIERPDAAETIPQKAKPEANDEVDAALLNRLKKLGLKESDVANDITFIRRLYLDILGVPPSRQEFEDFLKDKNEDKRTKLRDWLLAGGVTPGRYTGACQTMVIAADGVVRYPDAPMPSICHIEIKAGGVLMANFPDKELGRGKSDSVTLKPSDKKPREVWTATVKGDTYKATAIPYSPDMFMFRLEIFTDGKLVAGAQQFYAIPSAAKAKPKAVEEPKKDAKDDRFPDGRDHDFGPVKPGTSSKHVFRIVNTSTVPLRLNAVRCSSGCMTGSASKKVLQPKEEGKVEVTVDSGRFAGRKTIRLFLETEKRGITETFEFSITANSVEAKLLDKLMK